MGGDLHWRFVGQHSSLGPGGATVVLRGMSLLNIVQSSDRKGISRYQVKEKMLATFAAEAIIGR